MNTPLLSALVIVLSFFGVADAWYLTQSAYTETPLTCNIAGLDGCNTVAQSPYAHLMGYPLALYGVFFFGFVFVLAAFLMFRPQRTAALGLYILGVLGLVASILFVAIQLFLIKAICVYCLGSAFLSLLIYLFSRAIWKKIRRSSMEPAAVSVVS